MLLVTIRMRVNAADTLHLLVKINALQSLHMLPYLEMHLIRHTLSKYLVCSSSMSSVLRFRQVAKTILQLICSDSVFPVFVVSRIRRSEDDELSHLSQNFFLRN